MEILGALKPVSSEPPSSSVYKSVHLCVSVYVFFVCMFVWDFCAYVYACNVCLFVCPCECVFLVYI